MRKGIPQLVGLTEAAKIMGVSPQRAAQLVEAYPDDFPEPVAQLACGPIWTEQDIWKFQLWRPKKAGRPKKTKEEGK